MLVLPTRGQALSPSWLHQLGVAGDGFAEAAEVANLFEEVEAVIVDNAALSQGDTTTRAPHVRHNTAIGTRKWKLSPLFGTQPGTNLHRPQVIWWNTPPDVFASPDNPGRIYTVPPSPEKQRRKARAV